MKRGIGLKIVLNDKARIRLRELLGNNKGTKPLRIYTVAYGWGGRLFRIAQDEPRDHDIRFSAEGFDFIIEDYLYDTYSGFTINYNTDFLRKGFTISPKGRRGKRISL